MIVIESIIFIAFICLLFLTAEAGLSGVKAGLTGAARLAIHTTVGIGIYILTTYILSFLKLDFLLIPLFILYGGIGLARYRQWKIHFKKIRPGVQHLIILVVATVYAVSMYTSGYINSAGTMYLRSPHHTDALWNIALIRSLVYSFPPEHPAISGELIQGYHFLYNLFLSGFLKYLPVSILRAYFLFFPLLFSVLLVYGLYYLALRITAKTSSAIWGMLMALFGGSFAFIVPIIYGQKISWDDGFGINQPISLLVNPSIVASIVFMLYSLFIYDLYLSSRNQRYALVFMVTSGILVGLKVYAGMIFYGAFTLYAISSLIFQKKSVHLLPAVGMAVIAASVFLPFNARYGFLVYQPFWPPDRMMMGTLDFTMWELKRQTLRMLGSGLGVIKLEAVAFMVFLFGNLGTRILGLMSLKSGDFRHRFFTGQIMIWSAISFLVPLFFIQPIGAFNMIQMYWYFLVFIGLLAGIGLARLFSSRLNKNLKMLLAIILILTTLPSAYEKITQVYLSRKVPALSKDDLEFYNTLSQLGPYSETVLEIPDLPQYSPATIRAWVEATSPIIPALGNKRQFLAGEVVQFKYDDLVSIRPQQIAEIMQPQGMDYISEYTRLKMDQRARQILSEYSIKYIVVRFDRSVWFKNESWVRPVFKNNTGTVYEVVLDY
ncbi:hypothetical protein A2154_02085 [Candidatus Gottesmanbacteria bacterium RBG_16_43_7]|uniref:Glycosyltransferase RgtA/B/C/D-like domain-containing protein n=1 Tax=Candidatus Gottesmanbacteria bacterium RBG_16_43_7 TaxID=1798373 RepID=A0A1F5ZD83_9BACT|nr:MAG: hypothetical protein A2154_02085 [Candidatus Gottesmanbacteria bacterium RBG_16_43_7]